MSKESNSCDECGASMAPMEGCAMCMQCGFSPCK